MKVMIANRYNNSFNFIESKKDRAKFKRNVKLFKNSTEEAAFISIGGPIRITRKLKLEDKKSTPFKDQTR